MRRLTSPNLCQTCNLQVFHVIILSGNSYMQCDCTALRARSSASSLCPRQLSMLQLQPFLLHRQPRRIYPPAFGSVAPAPRPRSARLSAEQRRCHGDQPRCQRLACWFRRASRQRAAHAGRQRLLGVGRSAGRALAGHEQPRRFGHRLHVHILFMLVLHWLLAAVGWLASSCNSRL